MRDELLYLGKQIVSHKSEIAQGVIRYQEQKFSDQLTLSVLKMEQVTEWRMQLIEMLGQSLYEDKVESSRKVKEWTGKVGEVAIENGMALNESLKTLSGFRTAIWDIFMEQLNDDQISASLMLQVNKEINPILDEIAYQLNEVFRTQEKDQIALIHTAMDELSAPVVPIAEKIAILPLIGEIDTHRASAIMETALKKSSDLQLDYLFIDISGVAIMDTMVSHNIYQIINALKMMGVQSVLTGIRPEVAHTLGNLGITFEDLKTSSSLKKALEDIGFTQYEAVLSV
ncbi:MULTISPECIES: STAS domain-containing protein [Rossellomorea]|jgi:rsbT co-antagonist protein RsbR|uniref:STAS domain-containing protein n=1 Tax=Rossellomorea vietnamensis TaxID=218284 RepID=A0A6I6US11_9BACI|nr:MULTISPECIES: STAS domain-containing protein [Rossellomorea]MCA0148029.1 STAS domain-containing protein [Rossellomorea vietnamensis]MCC5800610.1 STAS domain-containing protein [Rossellomorea vietnamensis]QHE61813.1 STAS domain-containing protein [Rossellomorea vietnamensis]WGG43782.1 STAS domain-containing protein [Rossellomorea sp. DA94]